MHDRQFGRPGSRATRQRVNAPITGHDLSGRHMQEGFRRVVTRALEIALPIAAIFLLWQLIVSFKLLPFFLVPPPITVFTVMITQWELLLWHGSVTALEVFLGFLFAVVIGIPLGLLIVSSSFLERTIYPLMVGAQAIPKVALGPLFVLAFGYGVLP